MKTAIRRVRPTLIPRRDGRGALLSGGLPGNRGGSGRPSTAQVEWCRQVLADPVVEAQVIAVLRDANHPAFAAMWKAVAERAYGKPTQPVDHSAGGEPVRFTLHLGRPLERDVG